MIHEEKHLTSTLTSEDKVSEKGKSVKELSKELCEKSGCHHKCHDTKDCVVEDEAKEVIANSATTKEKQIEEMAKAVCVNCMDEVCASGRCAFQWDCPLSMETIKKLYNAGYRKQSEGEWEMISNKAFAKAMRENAVINDYGQIICSPELWEQIASIIENIGTPNEKGR